MIGRRRFRWRRLTNPALIVGFAIFVVAAVWILAPLCAAAPSGAAARVWHGWWREAMLFRAMMAVSAAWFFFFGASVGSFLNVVVWRLPRGETLVWRPSRCPRCGAGIRPDDNLPVFGWLKLRGRCRTCRMPISPRYPLVELTMGVVFVSLAMAELFLLGANLPLAAAPLPARGLLTAFEIRGELVAVFVYHAFLASVLLSWALIACDRQRVPPEYVTLALFVSVVAPVAAAVSARALGYDRSAILSRPLHPLPAWFDPPLWLSDLGWLDLAIEPLVGLLVGCACGLLLRPAGAGASRPLPWCASLALAGAVLGWQAAVSAAMLASVFLLLLSAGRPTFAERWLPGVVFLAVLLQLFGWSWFDAHAVPLGRRPSAAALFGVVALTTLLAVVAGRAIAAHRPRAAV